MLLRLRLMPIALLMFVLVLGCGGGDKPPDNKGGTDTGKSESGSKKALEKLASTGWGTIEGKVVFDGEPPTPKDLTPQIAMKEADAAHCKMGKTVDETWVVGGADKGVANVIVWLRAPKGKYFDIPEKAKTNSDTVTLGQPYCAFEPHVIALFPSYYDGGSKKQKPTGQKFKVVNDATISHNTNITPKDPIVNPGGLNELLKPKSNDKMEERDLKLKPCKDSEANGEQSFTVACNIHPWMKATGRIFDHPFFAVTTGGKKDDKEFGSYKIENAPAGVELELVYWHESMDAPKVLKKITLKDKETTKEEAIKIK